jgi:hypothetical protein
VKLWIKILIVLLIAFVIFTGIDIVYNSSIPYGQVSNEPIGVYWVVSPVQQAEANTSSAIANLGEFQPPQYFVNFLTLSISDPVSSTMSFQINCGNYTQYTNFLTSDGSGLNLTEIEEYKNVTQPDIMITCPLIKNGNFSSWIQLWQQYQQIYPYQPLTKQLTRPFFTQTSFDTWEAQFRFDNSFGMLQLFNETFNITAPLNNPLYMKANVSQISFEITLPNNYQVQNPNSVTIESVPTTPLNTPNEFVASENITAGQTFDLRIIDTNLEPLQNTLGFIGNIGVSAVIIASGVDLIIEYVMKKQKTGQPPTGEPEPHTSGQGKPNEQDKKDKTPKRRPKKGRYKPSRKG